MLVHVGRSPGKTIRREQNRTVTRCNRCGVGGFPNIRSLNDTPFELLTDLALFNLKLI
jgi:hypothetical protein